MSNNEVIQKAIEIALDAHEGVERRDGDLYFNHVARVANNKTYIFDPITKAAAYLHDVVEDTPYTLKMLAFKGISDEVIDVVNLVTKPDYMTYQEYIEQNICSSVYAMLIKLSDLEDNSDIETLGTITDEDIERFQKYEKAKETIWTELLTKHPETFKKIKGIN